MEDLIHVLRDTATPLENVDYTWDGIINAYGHQPDALIYFVNKIFLLNPEKNLGDFLDFMLNDAFLTFPQTAKLLLNILPIQFEKELRQAALNHVNYDREISKFYITLLSAEKRKV
jgi:hypothetical protein